MAGGSGFLVMGFRKGDAVQVGDALIRVQTLERDRGQPLIRLAIQAPRDVPITRRPRDGRQVVRRSDR